MISRQKMKNDAKLDLQGHWGLCIPIAALNIYMFPLIQFSAENLMHLFRRHMNLIYNIRWIAVFILLSGFTLGAAYLFLNITGKKESDAGIFFSSFDNIFRAVLLFLLITIFVSLWSVLLIVPGIIAAYRYKMAVYILAESPELSPLDSIRISKKMTDGKKWGLFLFDLSFIGWIILTAATAGLAGLYVFPYYNASLANYYRELKIEYIDNRNSERQNEDTQQKKEDYRSEQERENHTWEH